METFGTIVLYALAALGALSLLSSVGLFLMTYKLGDPDPDVAAIVEAHTQASHVRVVSPAPHPSAATPEDCAVCRKDAS